MGIFKDWFWRSVGRLRVVYYLISRHFRLWLSLLIYTVISALQAIILLFPMWTYMALRSVHQPITLLMYHYRNPKAVFLCLLLFVLQGSAVYAYILDAGSSGKLDTVPSYLFFAGLTPSMIGQGQWEFNLYNALSTQKYIPALSKPEVYRGSSLQQALQLWHNPFPSDRVNVGLGLRLGHQLTDLMEDRSPLRVLGGGDESSTAYHGLAAVGPAVRFIPFARLPELSIQSSFLLPIGKDLATRQALGWDRSAFLLQGAFQQQLSPWLYGFVSTGATLLFKNDDRMQSTLSIPTAVYLAGRVAQSKWYVLADLSYVTSYNDRFEGPLRHVFSQWLGGAGLQFYPSNSWTLLLLWERSLGMNNVGSSTEFINGSFNQVSLGVRYLTW